MLLYGPRVYLGLFLWLMLHTYVYEISFNFKMICIVFGTGRIIAFCAFWSSAGSFIGLFSEMIFNFLALRMMALVGSGMQGNQTQDHVFICPSQLMLLQVGSQLVCCYFYSYFDWLEVLYRVELLQERAGVFLWAMSPLLVVMLQIPIKSYVVPTMLMELSLSLGALTLMQG